LTAPDGVLCPRVIVIHPSLPVPAADAAAAACHAMLAPLIADYARRFPTQCRYLAFPPWSTAPLAKGADA
jgi:hypothetical protein